HDISVARLIQSQTDGGAILHVISHEATYGAVDGALAEISALPESREIAAAFPVISQRGISALGWA
ncbi:MAG: ACT domain-containing protein, partial [Gaiellaceae bacterium]